jgi:hypothetical protein
MGFIDTSARIREKVLADVTIDVGPVAAEAGRVAGGAAGQAAGVEAAAYAKGQGDYAKTKGDAAAAVVGAGATILAAVPVTEANATRSEASAAAVADIITRAATFPGWLRAFRDKKRRLISGITDAGVEWAHVSERDTLTVWKRLSVVGNLDVASLPIGNLTRKASTTAYPDTLYPVTDSKRRILSKFKGDGTFWARWIEASRATISDLRTRSSAVSSGDWIAFTKVDASGNWQVYTQQISTGRVRQVTTTGNHRDLAILGNRVGFLTDGKQTETAPLDASSAPIRMIPASKIVAVGHSMLANYQPARTPLPSRIAAALGVEVVNLAVQGANSDQMVARLGLVAGTITVAGDQIPASGFVTIISSTPVDFLYHSYNFNTTYGWLAGVYGAFTWHSVDGERFIRAAPGAAVACPPGTAFVPDNLGGFDNVAVIWMMINDNTSTQAKIDATIANVQLVVNALRSLGRRFLILSDLNNSFQPAGSQDYNRIISRNTALQALYPNNYLDARAILVAAYNPAIPADVTAHAEDRPPPSLLEDDIFHPSNAGNTVLLPAILNDFAAKGWF